MSGDKNSTSEARKKRLDELEKYFSDFKLIVKAQELADLEFRDNSAKVVNEFYYRLADEIIRPAIDSGTIQNYKIVSGTELVILRESPIIHSDIKIQRHYNVLHNILFAT